MEYKVGDIIEYKSFLDLRVVKVTEKEEDVKNGYPGFCGIVVKGKETGEEVWGYDSQIRKIIKEVLTDGN